MAINRIVVFGGTFDPVHNGHIATARCMLKEMRADLVLVVPTGRPWLRSSPPCASPADRLHMVELATVDEPEIKVSDVDVVREKTTYSVDTIADLRKVYGDDCEYILAVGSDAAAELHRWHQYDELVRACRFAVIERPGAALDRNAVLPSGATFVRGPMIDVSASEIRRTYAQGDLDSAARLVPELAHRFIIEKGLYRCVISKQ